MNQIHPDTRIGAVTLTVADLARSLAFYQDNIGLRVLKQEDGRAVLGAGDEALLILEEVPGAKPARRATGLYHFALLVPSRLELARTIQHLAETRTPIDGASDHLVSEALYLHDPDRHGIEIYRDRPRSEWVDAQGNFRMDTLPLDLDGIMAELNSSVALWDGLHPKTTMGHIHLQVSDLAQAGHFYRQVLAFDLMTDAYPGALFVSAGGYHHHIGMNTWASAGAAPPPPDAARLVSYEILLPDSAALEAVVENVKAAGVETRAQGERWLLHDPSQNQIVLRAVTKTADWPNVDTARIER